MIARRSGRVLACGGGSISVFLLSLTGCSGPQSGLDPAGLGADRIATLFWWMTAGALLVWGAVIWLAVSAIRGRVSQHTERQARLYVIGGGAILPTVVLTGLLLYGLGIMPELLAPAPAGSLKITVTGEQWWWRVRYHFSEQSAVELANEIRLPVGERVEFQLQSPDVIHSFWIPSLGGKMDMIPGRRTRLALEATHTGHFRGVCAEYCGSAHALMGFSVVVQEKQEFARWLARQAEPARSPSQPLVQSGRDVFFGDGCSACHTIRGTPAAGVVGPDLTHVGSRESLAAAILPNDRDGFSRWLWGTEA